MEIAMSPDPTMSSRALAQDSKFASPATGLNFSKNSSNHQNGGNSHGRSCQHEGCSSAILTGGEYCMFHKKSESPVRPVTDSLSSQLHGIYSTIISKPRVQPTQAPKVNGHVENLDEGKSGDAITVNTTRQPMQPANGKKQLPGKSVARKSAGVSRLTPRIGQSPEAPRTSGTKAPSYFSVDRAAFPDPRPAKRFRVLPVNGDNLSEKEPIPIESCKTNSTVGEEKNHWPEHKENADALTSRRCNGGLKSAISDTHDVEEQPPGRDPTGDHAEAQPVLRQTSPRSTREQLVTKGEEHQSHKSADLCRESPHSSRGHIPADFSHSKGKLPERNSEPPHHSKTQIKGVQGPLNTIGHNAVRSEPSLSVPVSIDVLNGVNGIHTQARFAILQPPSPQNDQKVSVETSPAFPVLSGPTDSDTPLISKNPSNTRSRAGFCFFFRNKVTSSNPTTESASRTLSATSGEDLMVNGFDSLAKGVDSQPKKCRRDAFSVEERQKLLVEKHNPETFDSYIYSKANEPFRPGSALFNIPWYEQPPRPIRPATHFGYFDPRVHWSQPKPEQWHRDKQEEVVKRGGKKANYSRAAASAARRKQDDQRADHRVQLPERVVSNQKWLAALDELDEMVEANRLRKLGIGQKKPRRKRKKKQQQQHQHQKPEQEVKLRESEEEGEQQHPVVHEEQDAEFEDEEEEYESPTKAKQQRRRGRKKKAKKCKARDTVIIDDDDEDAYNGGDDDEYMDVVSDS